MTPYCFQQKRKWSVNIKGSPLINSNLIFTRLSKIKISVTFHPNSPQANFTLELFKCFDFVRFWNVLSKKDVSILWDLEKKEFRGSEALVSYITQGYNTLDCHSWLIQDVGILPTSNFVSSLWTGLDCVVSTPLTLFSIQDFLFPPPSPSLC